MISGSIRASQTLDAVALIVIIADAVKTVASLALPILKVVQASVQDNRQKK
jgi:hypothetical protein